MPFVVDWSEEARQEVGALIELALRGESSDILHVVQAALGRRHDDWLRGRPSQHPALADRDIRMLENGSVMLVYEVFEAQRRVKILNIIRARGV